MKKFETRPETANVGTDNDALESLLRSARGDGFTRTETDQIWTRLGPIVGAHVDHVGLNSSTGSLPPKALGFLGANTKGLLLLGSVVVAAGLAAVGVAGVSLRRAPLAVESRPPAAATGNDPGSWHAIESAPVGTLGGLGAVDNPFSGLAQGGVPATPSFAQSPNPSLSKRMASPARTGVDTRAAAPKTAHAGTDKRVGETNTESSESSESKDAPAPATQPPTPADQTINEGALLLRARRELVSNPSDTLRLTEEHSRVFPTGTLVPESEVLTIEALVQLGRLSEARARFAAFRARYPQSAHLARLEGLVGP